MDTCFSCGVSINIQITKIWKNGTDQNGRQENLLLCECFSNQALLITWNSELSVAATDPASVVINKNKGNKKLQHKLINSEWM